MLCDVCKKQKKNYRGCRAADTTLLLIGISRDDHNQGVYSNENSRVREKIV